MRSNHEPSPIGAAWALHKLDSVIFCRVMRGSKIAPGAPSEPEA